METNTLSEIRIVTAHYFAALTVCLLLIFSDLVDSSDVWNESAPRHVKPCNETFMIHV